MDKSYPLQQALDALKQGQNHTHRMLDELEANHRVLWGMVKDLQEENARTAARLDSVESRTRDIEQTSRYDLYDSLYFLSKSQPEKHPKTHRNGKKALLIKLFEQRTHQFMHDIPF